MMMDYWETISENINARDSREKIIIGGLSLAVVWALFQFFLISKIDEEKLVLNERMKSAEAEIKKFTAQERVLAKAMSDDPNAQKRHEIIALEQKLTVFDKRLEELSVGLISAENLPIVLRDVMKSINDLTLIGMQTLESSELKIQRPEDAEDGRETSTFEKKEKEEDIGIFKHSVVVVLEGKYFDVVKYLTALEGLPWKIYWQEIDYEVSQYPKAKVMIEVYTLSTERGFLGV